jgi:hypothetical protein
MSEEDYKIAYENVMIANKMLEQENKQLKDELEKYKRIEQAVCELEKYKNNQIRKDMENCLDAFIEY